MVWHGVLLSCVVVVLPSRMLCSVVRVLCDYGCSWHGVMVVLLWALISLFGRHINTCKCACTVCRASLMHNIDALGAFCVVPIHDSVRIRVLWLVGRYPPLSFENSAVGAKRYITRLVRQDAICYLLATNTLASMCSIHICHLTRVSATFYTTTHNAFREGCEYSLYDCT